MKFLMPYLFILSTAISFSAYAQSSLDNKSETPVISLPIKELKNFNDIFFTIKESYVEEVSDEELINNAIKGMISRLDPHSSYFTKDEFSSFADSTSGRFAGVGLSLSYEDKHVVVVSPIADSPADKAGILSGDKILQVDGKSLSGLSFAESLELLRGKVNSDVQLTILRKDEPDYLDFTITRQYVKSKRVISKIVGDDFAYVYVSQFSGPTGSDIKKALDKLHKENSIKGLVLDLRNNPGGLLSSAIEISDMFLDEGIIVSTKSRETSSNSISHAIKGDLLNGKPIIVLINSGSASASEIVAGALQDNKRAIIIGTTSFGKGSVQHTIPLSDGSGMKLTTARYYTPNNRSIQAQGITPDIEVKPLKLVDSSSSSLSVSEASLSGHISNDAKQSAKETETTDLINEDYVLYQAITILKSLSVLSP